MSCKDESWKSISKYLMEQVPQLLKAEAIDSVEKILSPIFESLPANLTDLIKWIAEVRRLESAEKTVDNEEAERLAIKGEILQQIRETEMYKVVDKWASSATSCCTLSWSAEANLSDIVKSCCCQGASTLCGMVGVAKECFSKSACMKNMSTCDTASMAIVSGTVVANGSEQGIDVLVPTATQIKHPPCCNNGESSSGNLIQRCPASKDLLTILVLALPPQTWHGLQEKDLREEIYRLVSLDNLLTGLREEVLHLRRQLHFLYKFHIGRLEEDLQDPLVAMP